ncbi:DMT family transporter [Aliagarivorans marinus]|uniref:DMT family transporter n=1 Tax=Aliagarivorans marinus TaxID=561965 RepID=UPI00047B1607|nr:DMT family transporter [Aliagarivorans marinus]
MPKNLRGELLMVFTTVLAASGWVFSKEAIAGIPPFSFIGLRFVAASLLMVPFCLADLRRLSLKQLGRAAVVGCVLGITLSLWISGVAVSNSLGEGAFIMSLSMLFVPLLSWLLFGRRPARVFWLSLVLAVTGLALLNLQGGWQQSLHLLLFLAASLGLAFHFLFNSRLARSVPILALSCVQLLMVGLIASCLSLLTEQVPEQIPTITWYWVGISALVATSLRYFFQTRSQSLLPAESAAILMLLEPVWTVILSVLLYQEQLSLSKLAGCSLILFALLLFRLGQRGFRRTRRQAQ